MRRALIAGLVVLVSTPTFATAGQRVGIFVGSNGAPSGLTPLQHAEHDAERMRRVFVDLGGLDPSDAHLLQSPSADAIVQLIARVGGSAKMMVFYYSGHADNRALLLDGSQLSFTELRRALDANGSQLSLHLIDACRSGALARRKGASLGRPFELDSAHPGEGRVVITSSAEWEDSHESDRISGSFFTMHMATGLRGAADGDHDGRVTLSEAYSYVYGRTVETTLGSRGGVQHPTFAHDWSGRGDLVLTWPPSSGGTITFSDGDYVVVSSHTGRIAAEVTTPDTQLSLPSGNYRIRKRTRSEVLSGRVQVAQGQNYEADRHLVEREAHARLVRKGGAKSPRIAHTARVMGGIRGRVADGVGTAALFRAGYEATLPWLSAMPFVSVTTPAAFDTPRLRYRSQELGLGVLISRAVDLPWLTLKGGLMAEAMRLSQVEVQNREAARSTWGGAFALHAALQSPPFLGDFVASVVAEAAIYVYRGTDADREPAGPGEVLTRPSYRALLALGYEF